jgi:hypothetical protein
MADIFENTILCKNCKKAMKPILISKNGFNLRAMKCGKCNETIFHPNDQQEYENFIRLKQKEFNVKMRMVGNSYAVSIPREIVDFLQDQENVMNKMNNMVRLCFQDANRLSLSFGEENSEEDTSQINKRIIKAREVKIIKDNKPVLHAKQFYDSAHPERNQTKIFKANKSKQDADEEKEEEL